MITKMSHATVWVKNQQEALEFYRDKLGFEVDTDAMIGEGVFEADDIYKTYEELKAQGVEFKGPPTTQSWGTATVMKDNSGNWFSLGQDKATPTTA